MSYVFSYRTLHVSDRFTVHRQESSTVYTATGICHAGYADCLLAKSDPDSGVPRNFFRGVSTNSVEDRG